MICGIDEAGRGPVIGPLVVSLVLCDNESIKWIEENITKDSKRLSRKRREELFKEIKSRCICLTKKISAKSINKSSQSINIIEMKAMRDLIKKALAKSDGSIKIYADSVGKDKRQSRYLSFDKCELHIETKADEKYAIVAAASIVAKVTRDREIDKLHLIYGNFGSGYPSDPRTKAFLLNLNSNLNGVNKKSINEIIRHRWKTVSQLKL